MYCIGIACVYIFVFVQKQTGAQTLSGNGSSTSGSAVAQGSALTLTCSTSQNAVGMAWWKMESSGSQTWTKLFDMALRQNGNCGFLGEIPTSLTCNCISARVYTCTISAIQNDDHGDTWRCEAEIGNVVSASNNLQINVLVGVSWVTLTPDLASLTVIEGESIQLQCKTSGGRPEPTVNWYKVSSVSGASPVTIKHETGTNSILTYTPSRVDNGWTIYCTASNVESPVYSQRRPLLNVSYGPGPPSFTYRGQTVTGPISIVQGSTLVISCLSDSKPDPMYTWTYLGGSYTGQTLQLSSIQTTHGRTFTVIAWYTISPTGGTPGNRTSSSNIEVNILYSPTVPTFSIGSYNVSGTIKIISGNSKTIRCSSQSNPTPRYIWTPGETANNADLVLSNVQHPSGNKQYMCTAENTIQSTGDISSVVGRANETVTVEVLFPPTTPVFRYSNVGGTIMENNKLSIVRGEGFPVFCVSQANPSVSSYSWSFQNPASQELNVAFITVNTTRTCTAQNNMVETYGPSDIKYGDTRTGTQTQTLTITVWVPPSAPTITYQPHCNNTRSVTSVHTVKVIEGDSFCLTCDSDSSPDALYNWSATASSSSALRIGNVTRDVTKQITCFAENRMVTTFEGTVIRRNLSSVNVDVLYGPRVGPMLDQQRVKGTPFQYDCPYTPGNPQHTTFVWTHKETGRTWNGSTVNLNSVLRENDGLYTCNASNVLNATAEPHVQTGRHSGSFHLEVFFGAENILFSNDKFPGQAQINVSENTPVNMTCILESNPGSTMSIRKDGQLKLEMANTNSISYSIEGRCEDTGVHNCTGKNDYPGSPWKQIDVRVLCSARKSPNIEIQNNVSSAQSVNATLSFHALAYPEPHYTWQNCSSSCTDMVSGIGCVILSSGLVTTLTIVNVEQHDYGSYRVIVSNGIGTAWNETFQLIPNDRPQMPTMFDVLTSTLKHNEVTVTWTPGFNGGQQQIFHIMYMKKSGGSWMEKQIKDTGANKLNLTISGLSPGTEYVAFMFSNNTIGPSIGTDNVTFTTSQLTISGTPAALIGGAVGGSAAAIIIIVVVVIFLLRKRQGGQRKQKDGFTGELMQTSREQNEEIPDEVRNPMYISADSVPSNTANAEYATPVKKKPMATGAGANASSNTANAVYASPMKKKPITTGSGDLYTTVDLKNKTKHVQKDKGKKKKDKKSKTDVYENPPLGSTKKTYDNKAFEENLYENNESVSTKKNVSPDGLIYADLDFPNQPKGQKQLVIHGLDDRTEYAEVDLTRKADPLPDSDSEDKKK